MPAFKYWSFAHEEQSNVLRPASVKPAWTWTPKSPTLPTAPIIADHWVVLGGQDGAVRGIDLKNGTLAWSVAVPTDSPRLDAAPASRGGPVQATIRFR